jgi:hypothetical protein
MATFNNSAAYSILNTQKGTYYVQGGHYFVPATFVDLGTTAPSDYQSLSSERSDKVSITGGALDGVTVGPNSTINATFSGTVSNGTITGSTITGGTINGTPIGQSTPAAGAFLGLNATSASILGPCSGEGVSSTVNGLPASITNTGPSLDASPTSASLTLYDSTRTANNKTADVSWFGGVLSLRLKNDAGSSATAALSVTGGQAAGISGITSNSGSGAWTHTGDFAASGVVSAGIQSSANALQLLGSSGAADTQIRTVGTSADISIQVSAKGAGSVKLQSPTSVTSSTGSVLSVDTTDANGSFIKLSNSGTVMGYYGSGKALASGGLLTDLSIRSETGVILFAKGSAVQTRIDASGTVTLSPGFTVAGLPAASTALKGARAFVTDANNPVWNNPVAGSGSNTVPVFCNGNAWVCG